MTATRFSFSPTSLDGLTVVWRKAIEDERGFLCRVYCSDEFRDVGLTKDIVQINHTLTRIQGAVRGLHYQCPPHCETKIVNCLRGEIFDVAVDLRQGSPTFLRWYGEILSADNRKSLLIPEGFAHGFQTLTSDCELLYFHTAAYAPGAEGGLHVLDPHLAIVWPLPVEQLSNRDQGYAFVDSRFRGICI
ncbi:MAG: dTDP-4-dehydrorhamnose 3,5-epimerase [Solirubrobacterales bacterium]